MFTNTYVCLFLVRSNIGSTIDLQTAVKDGVLEVFDRIYV